MIIPMRWSSVRAGARVIDPTGAMFHVKPRMADFLVQVADRSGRVHTVVINPNAYVPVVMEAHDIAIANLSQHFTLDYLGESR